MLTIADHPLLDVAAFVTDFGEPLSEAKGDHRSLFSLDANVPLTSSDEIRKAVRDLFRHGGFKPTGRSKPASEYLIKAVTEKLLSPINLAVDVLNAVSLHSGLPISVVDLELASEPFRIDLAPVDSNYVFNATGQTIKLDGLLCLFDAIGPCANGVKDCQRTKTHNGTRRTLSVVWGTNALPGHTEAATAWYRQLLSDAGASVHDTISSTKPG